MSAKEQRCGVLISGLYSAETICQRPRNHVLPHKSTDGIWHPWGYAVEIEAAIAARADLLGDTE